MACFCLCHHHGSRKHDCKDDACRSCGRTCLYSLDGIVSLDDSNNLRLEADGSFVDPIKNNIDMYVFIYKVDFGLCVQDYFKLTGLPALIPRYALGNWWSRDKAYTTENILKLEEKFEKLNIPI